MLYKAKEKIFSPIVTNFIEFFLQESLKQSSKKVRCEIF